MDALVDLAWQHGLALVFDAAHALGCSYKGRMIGGFGDAELFSFHATKFINTFEGGAVVTNSDELAARLRLMRNFGFTGFDTVACLGTNGKMNEVCAAMGLNSIASMGTFIEINRRHYDQYRRQMAIVPGVSLALYNEGEKNNYQYIALQVERETAGLSRDDLEKILWAENVLARRYFYPGCHRMEPYRSEQPTASTHLPNTQWLAERIICLPTGSAVTSNDVASICALVSFVIKNGAAVQERLATSGSSGISLMGKFSHHSKA
jgi:dTDP-4-amino-4,6-dideoxygalactose transaminase